MIMVLVLMSIIKIILANAVPLTAAVTLSEKVLGGESKQKRKSVSIPYKTLLLNLLLKYNISLLCYIVVFIDFYFFRI